ncbi:MAG TPA: nucleotidyltransferase family protein, partial [Methylomirabilota bacterium]|nr:nucleotidyltransferase family protein [Methylomirabilota bacterium]
MHERRWLAACLAALGRDEPPPPAPVRLDWSRLLDVAEAETLTPALAHAILGEPALPVPGAARRRLLDALAAGRGRHLVMSAALARVLDVFAAAGVETIVLKGP